VASAVESFCGGLGTSAFLAFLMSVCRKEFSATQYAILSALFQITGTMAAAPSGWLTEKTGFAPYFALTFLLSLPAFLFVSQARQWIPPNGQPAEKDAEKVRCSEPLGQAEKCG
jgi:PAT family beta-lactamase induction signal transducer AmpG